MATFALDPAHSSVEFTARHMVFSRVRGTFPKFTLELVVDETTNLPTAVSTVIDATSIDTNVADRDAHTRICPTSSMSRSTRRFHSSHAHRRVTRCIYHRRRSDDSRRVQGGHVESNGRRPRQSTGGATTASRSARARRSIVRISGSPGIKRSRPAACWSAKRSRSRSRFKQLTHRSLLHRGA